MLTCCGILHKRGVNRPRACMIVTNTIEAVMLEQFCSQDITVAKVSYKSKGNKCEVLIASAYFPFDSINPPPGGKIEELVAYAESNKLALIIGCDANAQQQVQP